MDDKALYQQVLGIYPPWHIESVTVDSSANAVGIKVVYDPELPVSCPVCDKTCNRHDHGPKRQWRHLDTCQFKTIVVATIPRANCPIHGVLTTKVPWAETGSHYTAMFEAMVISWLKDAGNQAVQKHFYLSWDKVDGIMQRGIDRGLSRRKPKPIKNLGVDEKAFQKHHIYSTILLDKDNGTVFDVLDDRKMETLLNYMLREKNVFSRLESISLDMWDPYIGAILAFDSSLVDKMHFDRFHVASHFSKAIDKIRAEEHRELLGNDDERLKHTRFEWLKNSGKIDNRTRFDFMKLARSKLRTARAWAMKELASQLWGFTYRGVAEKAWKALIRWMALSRLEAMVSVSKTLRNYLWGILNAAVSQITNAASESINAVIQKIKSRACGFRNRERFRRAILFHLGGLDMMPKMCQRNF